MSVRKTFHLFYLLATILLCGCEHEPLRVYEAAKDKPPSQSAQSVQPSRPAEGPPLTWALPEGWTAQPGSGMRYATIVVGSDDQPVEVRVTPLGPASGDVGPNVNRWAGQVGLGSLSDGELADVVKSVQVDGRSGHIVNLVGPNTEDQPAKQVLAAIVPADERVWFFAMIDEASRITPHEQAFASFIESIRFASDEPEQVATPTTPRSGGKLAYQKPQGWQDDPAPSSMRAASFILDDGENRGEVAVTRFPGSVGGLLANINRWRGQVNLPPIQSLEEQAISQVEVDGQVAGAIDLAEQTPEDEADEAKRVIVIVLPREDLTWFFKMTGPGALIDKNKDAFAAFMHSVKFVPEE